MLHQELLLQRNRFFRNCFIYTIAPRIEGPSQVASHLIQQFVDGPNYFQERFVPQIFEEDFHGAQVAHALVELCLSDGTKATMRKQRASNLLS